MAARFLPPLLAVALICASQAPAQEDDAGRVRGTLDLTVLAWSVRGTQTDSAWHDDGASTSIRFVAAPEEADPSPRLTVSLSLTNDDEPEVTAAEVLLDRGDTELTASGKNLELTVTDFQRQGSDIAVTGNLSAALTKANMVVSSTEEPDATLDVSFKATLPPAN
ncbi:hypothetical protein [Tropicimonas isoalkanivorans]|uniref:Uncharacterized protein n=1 Tax=Tropicimonas isoalkanivorans TaxID=441112 RepID=A0A1I1KTU0_9RHOB|nr:hypothetical protein [Tropicimonas isoalkanivorans]SFC64234.1 hypothetical protein SAMN04488094_10783 [Tropicimonas isoalkanivorans]